jgi:activating signal cointegrator 1
MSKVLTLKQPWAQLVVLGFKQIETRSFKTPYRGELYIHSSAKFDPEHIEMCFTEPWKSCIRTPHELRVGYILGKVQLQACIPTEEVRENLKGGERELAFGDYSDGRYAWFLSNPICFKNPVHARGALGIWQYEHTDILY